MISNRATEAEAETKKLSIAAMFLGVILLVFAAIIRDEGVSKPLKLNIGEQTILQIYPKIMTSYDIRIDWENGRDYSAIRVRRPSKYINKRDDIVINVEVKDGLGHVIKQAMISPKVEVVGDDLVFTEPSTIPIELQGFHVYFVSASVQQMRMPLPSLTAHLIAGQGGQSSIGNVFYSFVAVIMSMAIIVAGFFIYRTKHITEKS